MIISMEENALKTERDFFQKLMENVLTDEIYMIMYQDDIFLVLPLKMN